VLQHRRLISISIKAYPHSPQGIEPGKKWIREANDLTEEELTEHSDWIEKPPFRFVSSISRLTFIASWFFAIGGRVKEEKEKNL